MKFFVKILELYAITHTEIVRTELMTLRYATAFLTYEVMSNIHNADADMMRNVGVSGVEWVCRQSATISTSLNKFADSEVESCRVVSVVHVKLRTLRTRRQSRLATQFAVFSAAQPITVIETSDKWRRNDFIVKMENRRDWRTER